MVKGERRTCDGSQMDDTVHVVEGFTDAKRIEDIALHELHRRPTPRNPQEGPVGRSLEVVEDAYAGPVALGSRQLTHKA